MKRMMAVSTGRWHDNMQTISDQALRQFTARVQHNADVADACFAGRYTLCIYLLKMRDYFRWHRNSDVFLPVDRKALGEWIAHMESHWESLHQRNSPWQCLPLPSGEVDCFANETINSVLNPAGYVYAGVRGRGGAPVFFLAELETKDLMENPEPDCGHRAGLNLLISGRELARTMDAPPAMSAPGWIFVRRDALRRYLGSMVEEWNWKREDNAMGQVVVHYGFSTDPARALERFLEAEIENVILHEIGERLAGALIGDAWQSLLAQVENPLIEWKIRAVRDHLADCLAALPACIALENWPSVDFFYANMTPVRKELFPSFCEVYQGVRHDGNYHPLASVISRAGKHWLQVSRELPRCSPERLTNYLDACAF